MKAVAAIPTKARSPPPTATHRHPNCSVSGPATMLAQVKTKTPTMNIAEVTVEDALKLVSKSKNKIP